MMEKTRYNVIMPTQADMDAENKKVRELARTVDLAMIYLSRANFTLEEAERLIAAVKAKALRIFPDKEETFDLIYLPRLRRIVTERFGFH
jgi:hypothetical protein